MSRKRSLLCRLLVVLLGFGASGLGRPVAAIPTGGTFTVNTSADDTNYNQYLSLREAIMVANGGMIAGISDGEKAQLVGCTFSGSPGSWTITGGCGPGYDDVIQFAASYTVNLNSLLPTLTDDGTTITAWLTDKTRLQPS